MTIETRYDWMNPSDGDYIVNRSTSHPNQKYNFVLYKLYFDNHDVYIGITNNMKRRYNEHQRRFKDIVSYRILYDSNSSDEIFRLEAEIVNEEFLKGNGIRNIKTGGAGGKLGKRPNSRPDARKRLIEDNSSMRLYWKNKKRNNIDKFNKSISAKENILNGTNPWAKKIKCPHCGKESNIGNIKRWHFNNCKEYN